MADSTMLPSVGLQPTTPTVDTHVGDVNTGLIAGAGAMIPKVFPSAKAYSDVMLAQNYRESTARAQDIINQATYATGELANEYASLKNKDAIDQRWAYVKKMQDINNGAIRSVDKDDAVVRRMVKDNLNSLMLKTGLEFDAHLVKETKSYEQETLLTAVKNAQEQAGRLFGTAEGRVYEEQALDYERQRLQALGIEEGSDAWNRALMECESGYYLREIKWRIDEGRLGEAAGYMKQFNSRMTREDYYKLHVAYKTALEAERARQAAAANQPVDFFAGLNKFRDEGYTESADVTIEDEQRVQLTGEELAAYQAQQQKQKGFSPEALQAGVTNALPQSLSGNTNGPRYETDENGNVFKVEKVTRKLTEQERNAYADRVARERMTAYGQYMAYRNKVDEVAMYAINNDLQGRLRNNGGQYISPFSREGADLFQDLVRLNNGDQKKAQAQWDNLQGLGTGNTALNNFMEGLYMDTETLLDTFSDVAALTRFAIQQGASGQDILNMQQRYSILKNKYEREGIKAQRDDIKNLLIQFGLVAKKDFQIDGNKYGKANAMLRVCSEIMKDLPPDQRNMDGLSAALMLASNQMRLQEAAERWDEIKARGEALDLNGYALQAYVNAVSSGKTSDEAYAIANDPERAAQYVMNPQRLNAPLTVWSR